MKTKIALITAVSLLALLALAGCSDSKDTAGKTVFVDSYTIYQTLPDGGKVLCVITKDGYSGGVSCDWANKTGGSKE